MDSPTDNHLALRQHRSSRITMANAYRTALVSQIPVLVNTIGVNFNGRKAVSVHVFPYFLGSDHSGIIMVQYTKRGRLIVSSFNDFTGDRYHRIHTMRTRDLILLRNALIRKLEMTLPMF